VFGGIASHVSGSERRPASEGVGVVLGRHWWLGCRVLPRVRDGRPAPSPVCAQKACCWQDEDKYAVFSHPPSPPLEPVACTVLEGVVVVVPAVPEHQQCHPPVVATRVVHLLAPTCARSISHPTLVRLKPRLAGFPQGGQGQGERQRGTPARSSWLPDMRSVPAAPTYAAMGDVARAGGVRILVGLSSGLSEGLAPEQLPRV
jgi:hypothetical protein